MNEVDAQHAFQPDGWASITGLGLVGLDDFSRCRPRNDGLHGIREFVVTRGLAVVLKAMIGCHGE
jgi:hypothetical protein